MEKWRQPISITCSYSRSNLIIVCLTSLWTEREIGVNEPIVKVGVKVWHNRLEAWM